MNVFLKKYVYSKAHSNSTIVFFSLATVLLLSFGLTEDAYAGTLQPDNYGLPDAFVNYDSVNNNSTVTWDFSALPDYTDGALIGQEAKCAVKVDYDFSNDPEQNPDLEITSFQPLNYQATYSPAITGVVLTSIIDSNVKGVEIPCTGQFTIDYDLVMGNAANDDGSGGSYNGAEPFISFYVLTSDEEFDTSDGIVLDEILIMYHPQAAEISQVTVDWACGANDFTDEKPKDGIDDNQIAVGNVLFIDQSGIRGTGGPGNCDTVVELESEEFCCTFYVAISSSNGCDDCIDPTFYYSQHKIIVKNGFSYNGYSTDVKSEHTETPPLITKINQTNIMKLKVYDNGGTDNIKWVDIGFGLANMNTSFEKAEVTIEIRLLNNVVQELKIHDPYDLVDFGDITSDVVDCGYVEENCLQVTIPHSFRDKFVNDMIVVKAIDYQPNEKIHYFNEGIHIEGTPNVTPTDKVFIQKYLGNPDFEWVDIVRVDRSNDIWVSDDGLEFTSSYGGGYLRIAPMGIDPNLE